MKKILKIFANKFLNRIQSIVDNSLHETENRLKLNYKKGVIELKNQHSQEIQNLTKNYYNLIKKLNKTELLPRLEETGFKVYSQFEEDGLLLYIFTMVGVTNKKVIEICAADGKECMASNLIINHGWNGLLFDGNKADLVSADGGFDFSTDYTNQELSAQKLIFCEMITGLSILKNRGHMVIKIFDIFYSSTVEIIYILSLYFESVYITKPCTSRPANSEKYIVCKFFKGIDTNKLIELYKIVSEYNSLSGRLYISSFINRPIPDDFNNLIFSYNLYSVAKQLKYILKTNSYINAYLLNDDINNIKNSQCINSLAWCYKYDFDINKKSRYVNLDSKYNYIPNFI